jgi:hypothetical protein
VPRFFRVFVAYCADAMLFFATVGRAALMRFSAGGQGQHVQGTIEPGMTGRVRLAAAVAILALALGARPSAAADDLPSYGERAKTAILQLVAGHAFRPERGCDHPSPCGPMLAALRAGKFVVVEPREHADRADLPGYLAFRRRCPSLDLAHVKESHRTYTATRNFAIYYLDAPGGASEQIVIFRAQHFVALEGKPRGNEPTAPWPGAYTSISLPGCRVLSTALAEDGDRFARHNKIDDADHASELLKMDNRYVVLNLVPIAGAAQPKESWWYDLELWDLGPRADADLRKQRRVYSFSYKPEPPSPGVARNAGSPG